LSKAQDWLCFALFREAFEYNFWCLERRYSHDGLALSHARYIYFLNTVTIAVLIAFLGFLLSAGDLVMMRNGQLAFIPVLVLQAALYIWCNHALLQGRLEIVKYVVIVCSIAAALVTVFLTGGFPHSIILQVLTLPACITFLLAGPRTGVFVAAGIGFAVLLQWYVSAIHGVAMPNIVNPAYIGLSVALANMTIFSMIIITVWLYDKTNRNLREQLATERARYAALARTDELTGLENKRGFDRRVAGEMGADRGDGEMAILYLDLDDFKAINDRHGHAAGDAILRTIASRIRARVRPVDIVGRLGGDEFAVMMPAPIQRGRVEEVCRELRAEISMPLRVGDGEHCVGVSIGARYFGLEAMDVASLIRSVDEAMYKDKLRKGERECGQAASGERARAGEIAGPVCAVA